MLALEWYRYEPLPDAEPEKALPTGPTHLSARLVRAFETGLHADFAVLIGHQGAQLLAHRLVLRRNPHLRLGIDGPVALQIPDGVNLDAVRIVLRAHYVEAAGAVKGQNVSEDESNIGPRAELAALQQRLPEAVWLQLEAVFGPLDAHRWLPLHTAVCTDLFRDIALEVDCGMKVLAHSLIVTGAEDGHFFNATLRWPGGPANSQAAGAASAEGLRSVAMPVGLSIEALQSLLKLRYGSMDIEAEHILEARHFAELLDWPDVRQLLEARLETLLASGASLDAESLLAVVSHAEESASLPAQLKVAALAAAVRHWSKVAGLAAVREKDPQTAGAFSAARRAELTTLHRIRHKDGHVCHNLEEYLHAAVDDLLDWEGRLLPNAPLAARRQVELAWQHWGQILFEYGRIHGAHVAEQWLAKVTATREARRTERLRCPGEGLKLPEGKVWFQASLDWREVPANAVCPGGLEFRCDMQTGRNFARIPP